MKKYLGAIKAMLEDAGENGIKYNLYLPCPTIF
jgi:hypothetical protein